MSSDDGSGVRVACIVTVVSKYEKLPTFGRKNLCVMTCTVFSETSFGFIRAQAVRISRTNAQIG